MQVARVKRFSRTSRPQFIPPLLQSSFSMLLQRVARGQQPSPWHKQPHSYGSMHRCTNSSPCVKRLWDIRLTTRTSVHMANTAALQIQVLGGTDRRVGNVPATIALHPLRLSGSLLGSGGIQCHLYSPQNVCDTCQVRYVRFEAAGDEVATKYSRYGKSRWSFSPLLPIPATFS
jgi:hypothetical protein